MNKQYSFTSTSPDISGSNSDLDRFHFMITTLIRGARTLSFSQLAYRRIGPRAATMIKKNGPVRLAILDCDTPLPKSKEEYGSYSGMFKALLSAGAKADGYTNVESVLKISCYNVEDYPEEYPDPEDIDAVLLTGSRHDSFDNATWILKLVDFTAKVLEMNRVKVIGVCFGHQIVARAMGIKVDRNPDGWEAGVTQIQLSPKGKQLFGLDSLRLHQMHRDIVFHHPQGVEAIGQSTACKVQGIYVPPHTFTVQGHPEFDEPIMREVIDTRRATGIFDDEAYGDHIKRVSLPHDGLIVGKAFVQFLLE